MAESAETEMITWPAGEPCRMGHLRDRIEMIREEWEESQELSWVGTAAMIRLNRSRAFSPLLFDIRWEPLRWLSTDRILTRDELKDRMDRIPRYIQTMKKQELWVKFHRYNVALDGILHLSAWYLLDELHKRDAARVENFHDLDN